jgi:SagB-type dehydrogenase family enzyme
MKKCGKMKAKLLTTLIIKGTLLVVIMIFPIRRGESIDRGKMKEIIKLTKPQHDGRTAVESTLLKRRSVRSYTDEPLTLAEISQLLWAAQGVTNAGGFRTAPSAGALYPLEIYIVAGKVTNLAAGIYKYKPLTHELLNIVRGDKRAELYRAALSQGSIKNAPVVLVFCAVYERTTTKYRRRGKRYVYIEVGHSSQNVCLQAVSLGLGTVTIGAFNDNQVKMIINCETDEDPLYIMPVGKPKS